MTNSNREAELQRVAEAIRIVRRDDCYASNEDMAQAAIKAMGGERGWMDISTAPKDGTRILVYITGDKQSVVRWERVGFSYHWVVYGQCGFWTKRTKIIVLGKDTEPTHWQPLPPSPSSEGA